MKLIFYYVGYDIKRFKKKSIYNFSDYYNLSNFDNEAELWYILWRNKKIKKEELKELKSMQLLKEAETFFPTATKHALHISLAQLFNCA